MVGVVAVLLAGVCLWLPSVASAQGAPVGCGYGTGGPNASTLCWLDMTGYNDTQARSSAGQAMAVTLPGGYTISFTIKSRGTPDGTQRAVASRAFPTNGTASYLGNNAYVNTPGKPALYTGTGAGATTTTLTLDGIQVRDSAGQTVTGYAFVGADAENTNNIESITWTSDQPIYEVANLSPFVGANGCQNHVTGLGTTTVSCTGNGSPAGGTYGTEIVATDAPTTFSQALYTGSGGNREGVAFALMTSKIEVTKSVAGRVRGSDSFDVFAASPEGSTIASASTGSGGAATTGELTVLPRTNGSFYTLGEAASAGSGTRLADYSQSWSCTKNGVADASLPSGAGTSVSVSPAPGDHIACTVTNTQLAADLGVIKSASPLPAVPGTNETYELVVTNSGPSRATNVRLSDPLPSGLSFVSASAGCGEAGGTVTCTVDSLDVGDSRTFTVTARIASSADSCAELRNTATVTSDTPEADPDNNEASICPQVQGRSDLSIDKTASDSELGVGGGQVMYTLVVHNDGPSDRTGVTVTDPLASGLTPVSTEASQGSCTTADGRVSCSLGRLAAGGSAQVLVTATASATAGSVTNTATVTGNQTETNPENNTDSATITVPPPPLPPSEPPPPAAPFDLAVTKTANDKRVTVGQPVRYRIVVANRGSAAAPDVQLTDTLNAPARLVSVKPSAGSCSKRIPMRCSLGTIAAGASVTISVVAKPTESACHQRNAASATGAGPDADPASNLDSVDVCAVKVNLRLSKVADDATVTAGELISYTIRVTNPTKGTASNVRTCDRLPAGLVFVSAKSKARLRGGAWCWRVKTIGPGNSKRYRITVRALRGASGRKVNRATAGGNGQVKSVRAGRTVRVLPTAGTGGGVTG